MSRIDPWSVLIGALCAAALAAGTTGNAILTIGLLTLAGIATAVASGR